MDNFVQNVLCLMIIGNVPNVLQEHCMMKSQQHVSFHNVEMVSENQPRNVMMVIKEIMMDVVDHVE